MSIESEARAELLARIAYLERLLAELGGFLVIDEPRFAWCGRGNDTIKDTLEARRACARFLRELDYTDDRDPGATIRLQGVIGCSFGTLHKIKEVNRAKQALHEFLMCLDAGVLRAPRGAPLYRQWTLELLRAIGRPRFNRRQATRQLLMLDGVPLSVSFF